VRLDIDEEGRVLRRSIIDFGEHPLSRSMHRARVP
jgi:hypothetical protein